MPPFVIGFFAVLAVCILLIVLYSIRQLPARRAWEKQLQALEYSPIDDAPEPVFSSVVALYRCSSRQYDPSRFGMWSVYEKRSEYAGFYIFDLYELTPNEGGRAWLGAGMIGVVSPYLRLPYLSIAGRGTAAGVVNTAFRKIGQAANVFSTAYGSLKEVSLAHNPAAAQKLLVMAEDIDAAWEFLTPARLEALTWLADPANPCQVECGGGCFTLRLLNAPANTLVKADAQLMDDGAHRLLELFCS